jgi:hypothetical protein
MGTPYPYQYFLSDKNLSLDEINMIASPTLRRNQSILLKYQLEIKNYIATNKLNIDELKKFNTLRLISDNIFKLYLINNQEILTFSKNIITKKFQLENYIESINTFLKMKDLKLFSPYLIHSYKENLLYKNPINFSNLLDFNTSTVKNKIYINYNKNKDKLEKTLDILFFGDYINLSLPSLGNINSYIGIPLSSSNFVNFIDSIITFFSNLDISNNNTNIIKNLPISYLDIDQVISNILINDINISLNNKNSNVKNLIENNIKSINFSLNDIMFDIKNKKIKPEFLIPYKIDNIKNKIIELKKGETLSKLKSLKDTVNYNFDIFYYVASKIFGDPSNGIAPDIKLLDQSNFKNVLSCFLFIIINLVYEYYKEYIRRLNTIIIDISGSNNTQFGKLNIKEGFEFMSLLNKSLYKLRLVLFNNFYNLFLPGKTQNTIYGMKKNEAGSYIPVSSFLIDNNYIFNNYPFNKVIKNITSGLGITPITYTINFDIDKDKLFKFITSIKSPNDIYDKNEKIEFGGFAFSQEITMEGFNMMLNFFKLYKDNCNFAVFIINLLYKNFTDDKKILIELFNDTIGYIPDMLSIGRGTKENKDKLIYILTKLYSDNITYSAKLFIKLYELVKKIKHNDSIYIEQKQIIKMASILYYFKAIGLDIICKKYINDIKIKNIIISKFAQIKAENELILTRSR